MEELEFASREDLEAIKADPHLSKVYQAMQAGVTKKFQGWSEENKKLRESNETLTQQIRELDAGLTEWEDWATQNKEGLTHYAEFVKRGGVQARREGREGKEGREEMRGSDDQLERINAAFQQGAARFERELTHLKNMLNYSMQLNDLYRRNPQLDGAKVLEVALKKGYKNLEQAYADEDAYGNEILDKKVEERLKPRVEEELSKRQTNIESGSGALPTSFELPKELPKNMTDAGQQFLKERAEEASKAQQ